MLQHMVNHASYHRGQVTTMLRQLGAQPAKSMDMIAFYREQAAKWLNWNCNLELNAAAARRRFALSSPITRFQIPITRFTPRPALRPPPSRRLPA